jgi:phage protein|nr:MAG TPA: Protein of unknown function (DUF1642) [Caudoviricetes sp.]
MNKQELIGNYKRISNFCETVSVNKVIQELEQLAETQKVQVPQFVADWIEECEENNIISLSGAFEYAKEEVDTWLSDWTNQEIFARAWLDGYTVEKEKRYYVRFKGMESGDFNYLNFIKFQHAWVLSSLKIDKKFRTEHTKKQLEEAGFGWVFDCPGIEIEEVE